MDASADSIGKTLDSVEKFVNLISKPINAVKGITVDNFIATFRIGFNDFLITSYNRCKFYKTVLSKSNIDLYSNYTNLYINIDNKFIKDTKLIENIVNGENIVLTGTAGGGKSMFMKYLTLSIFHKFYDKIPIFMELRKINESGTSDIFAFFKSQCLPRDSGVSESQFRKAFKAGDFVLILDGFDELNADLKPEIERQILSIKKDYPKISVVVSSRYDDRFSSWIHFNECNVEQLNKDQCLDIISKLVIDDEGGVKSRFYDQVKLNLYDSHKTFLSTPLLITIMLFTYERSGKVPENMQEFYARAFDALYERHDAMKGQYVRQKLTNLTKEQFSVCFSAFCALSYKDELYEFDNDSLVNCVDRAIKYSESKGIYSDALNVHNFIKDMVEAVCLLQVDGLYWYFVHRSFQEYFAALFLSNVPEDICKKLLSENFIRINDSVLPLLFGINKDLVQRLWILPFCERYLKFINGQKTYRVLSISLSRLSVSVDKNGKESFSLFANMDYDSVDMHTQFIMMCRINGINTSGLFLPSSDRYEGTRRGFSEIMNDPKFQRRMLVKAWRKGVKEKKFLVNISEKNDWILNEMGYNLVADEIIRIVKQVQKDVLEENKLKRSVLDEIM